MKRLAYTAAALVLLLNLAACGNPAPDYDEDFSEIVFGETAQP